MFDVNIQWRIQHLQMGEGKDDAQRSSAVGARIEAPRGVGRGGEGCSLHTGKGV